VAQEFGIPPKVQTDSRDQLLPGLSPEFLLAFLALTSKFHSTLILHHSPSTSSKPSNPLLAAEYYAAACKDRLLRSSSLVYHKDVSLQRCQAHLMLAMHEWGNCQGLQAWLDLTAAKREAQLLGLQYLDTAKESHALKTSAVEPFWHAQLSPPSVEDALIDEEVKRRTLWSCFVLERCLSSGMFRPNEFKAHDIGVQLLCSERAFLFGEKTLSKLLIEFQDPTSFGEKPLTIPAFSPLHFLTRSKQRNDDVADEFGVREPAISRYIRALDTFNAIIQYAGAGGRL
jgi:Fungal specific transcription factor domain